MTDNDEIFSKARALFAPELLEFATLFEGLLANAENVPTEEHISAAHRAKGGAGFLGFDSLRVVAGEAQEISQKLSKVSEHDRKILEAFARECRSCAQAIQSNLKI